MEHISEVVKTLSHEELCAVTKSSINSLINKDAYLSDLPSDVTFEEIVSLVAVEHGKSITVFVSREDEVPLKVIIPQNATIRELKKAVARNFEIYQARTGSKVKISWRYIWKTYHLCYDSLLLEDDNGSIENYGVAVEHGKSITVFVSREDEVPLKVIIPQNATIRELKKAVARNFEIYQARTGSKVKISWRYIWKTYHLCYDSLLLEDDNGSIENYGVTNKVTLTFKKRRKNKKCS